MARNISEGNCDGLGHIFVTILPEAIFFVKIVTEVYQINIKYLFFISKIPTIFRICYVEQNNISWDVILVRINNGVRNIVGVRFK